MYIKKKKLNVEQSFRGSVCRSSSHNTCKRKEKDMKDIRVKSREEAG